MRDVVIIGAGIIGSSIALELHRRGLTAMVIVAENLLDVTKAHKAGG